MWRQPSHGVMQLPLWGWGCAGSADCRVGAALEQASCWMERRSVRQLSPQLLPPRVLTHMHLAPPWWRPSLLLSYYINSSVAWVLVGCVHQVVGCAAICVVLMLN